MNKDNIIFGLTGIIIGLVAAVVFTLRTNNAGSVGASMNPNLAISAENATNAVPFGDLSHTNKDTPAADATGGGMQPQVRAALDAANNNPKDMRAQLNAAGMYYQIGNFDKAIEYTDRALAIEPNNVGALTAAGDIRFDKGDFVEAARFYEHVLEHQPNNVNVRTDLGSTFFQRTPPDLDRAVAEYKRSLEIDARHENTLVNLAILHLTRNEKEAARGVIDQLAAANPNNTSLAELRTRAT
ncbi:MAG: tetratricopeptide repeat protein [Pyrinomonadaceae bacterium MAG19_C2-C3]|nr:tetratricopeptide repeat protein [Pyrinomonadaceae bacterium MAG19_C2-C3]